VIPISERADTVRPMTKTVKDAAYILQAIAGVNLHDNCTSAIPYSHVPGYVAACNVSAPSGSRLGVPRNVSALFADRIPDAMMKEFTEALEILRAAGADVVDTNFPSAREFQNSKLPGSVIGADFVVNRQNYLEALAYNPNNVTSLATLREFTQSFHLEDYPERDTSIWDAALQDWNNTDPRFWPAFQQFVYYGTEGGLLGAISRDNLDAVVLPANYAYTFASAIGAPIMTVPLGSYPANVPIEKDAWGLPEVAPNIPHVVNVAVPGTATI
jgi:amidase